MKTTWKRYSKFALLILLRITMIACFGGRKRSSIINQTPIAYSFEVDPYIHI